MTASDDPTAETTRTASGRPTPTAGWRLAIDVGTSYTAAASERNGRITTILFDGSPRIPSVVAVDDAGRLVVAAVAEREMARAPERAERCPKRRIGDPVLLLGDTPVRPVDAIAAILRHVFDEAVHQSGGARPAEVVLTHPARWGTVRLGLLATAARTAGLPDPVFVAEPVAAAAAESEAAELGEGQLAAVFDLGGGTFDTAVVRRTHHGFELVGPPGGNDRVGGEIFDDRLADAMGERLARTRPDAWEQLRFGEERTWRRAAFDFRTAVRGAKEALSTHVDATVYLGAPVDAELRVTRDELEALVLADLRTALDELAATVAAAGVEPGQLRSVFLVGGSARIPLAARLVGEWLGRVPVTWGDPKTAVVIGALMLPAAGLRTLATSEPTMEMPAMPAMPAPSGPATSPVAAAVGAAGTTVPAAAASSSPTGGVTAAPASRADAGRSGRRRRVAIAAAAVVAIAAVGGVVAATRGGDPGTAGDATVETTTPAESSAPDDTTDATPVTSTTSPITTTTVSATTTTAPTASTASTAPTTTAGPTTVTTTPRVTTVPVVNTPPSGTAATTTTTPPTTAPPTAPPPPSTTVAPSPTTRQVPNLVGEDTSTARSAIQQLGFRGMQIRAGTCDFTSFIIGYSPQGEQPLSATIEVWCS